MSAVSAADTSVTIAALLDDHPAHGTAADALAECERTIAHVAIETFSVLTRLPAPNRPKPSTVVTALTERLASTYVTLDAGSYEQVPSRLAAAGVAGGSTYDGLIALTALEHELKLVSRDRRAARTYRALGVRFTLLG